MGNICSSLRPQKKMLTPRDIYELAETVDLAEGLELDECVHRSTWAQTFLKTPKMLDPIGGPDRRELFFYVICCSALSRTPHTEKENTKKILILMRDRFFADSEFWQANIAFMDIHNLQDDIFRLFYVQGFEKEVNTTTLRSKLLALRQDETIRSTLEPVYGEFLKRPSLHPSSVIQQCILSLL